LEVDRGDAEVGVAELALDDDQRHAKFHTPSAVRAEPESAPVNTLGIRRIMFGVDDVDDVVARLRSQGAELVGEITQYEDSYRLCFLRSPEGIIIGVAEQLS
jgi:predicted enzyme related to lactoylglutathione lyase